MQAADRNVSHALRNSNQLLLVAARFHQRLLWVTTTQMVLLQ
jgi:hypothetical protein